MHGGIMRLMRGLYDDAQEVLSMSLGQSTQADTELKKIIAALQEKGGQQIHHHAGITVDPLPQAEGATAMHIQSDWLKYALEDNSVDAIFFEQLPPTGINAVERGRSVSHESEDFLPRAIEKARVGLVDEGYLVIQLALDTHLKSDYTLEDLERKRKENPFCGYLKAKPEFFQSLYESTQSKGESGPLQMQEAIRFYRGKLASHRAEVINVAKGATDIMKQFTELQLNKALSPFEDTTLVDMTDILSCNKLDLLDHVSTLLKLIPVYRQKDMMLEYLHSHGFKNAEINWLDPHQHEFNKNGGWFITAQKDPVGISKKV